MKKYRLPVMIVLVLISLVSGLVLAQEVTVQPVNGTSLPPDMESALVPCASDVTGPCDLIATSAEDIVGVWKQYLGNPAFNAPGGMAYIRYNADGTFSLADTVENTVEPLEGWPSGTYHFDGAQFIIDAIPDLPAPCNGDGIFQLRVLKYGNAPVALRYVPINDACVGRLQDLSQALVWVAN